jgi:flagellar motor switch protein FliN/FliY
MSTTPPKDPEGPSPLSRLAVLGTMPVEIQVHLGRAKLTLRDVLNLEQGSMIELTKLASEPPLDVMLNGRIMAHGTAVALGDQLGVRLTELVPAREELPALPEFLHPRPGDPVPFRTPVEEDRPRYRPAPADERANPAAQAAGAADDDGLPNSDKHPLADGLAACVAKANAIQNAPQLAQTLPRLEMFVEPLNAVLFGQPASHFTTTGDVIDMKTPGEWADAFIKDWLDEVCAWHADAVVGGRDHTPGPEAVTALLRELHEKVLQPLGEHLYVEVVLVLTPSPVDSNKMKIVARLPTGGTTACAVRNAGLIVKQKVIRQAGVVVG